MSDDKRWLLLRPNEDGNPLRWVSDAELPNLLADPSQWGVSEFGRLNKEDSPDPNYWHRGLGVLLRVEVVVPERGGWRLPDADAPSPSGYDLIKGDLRGEAA